MYARSDYKYPMHDGRVLDAEKNGFKLYNTGEGEDEKKKKEERNANNLPKPKVKGAK